MQTVTAQEKQKVIFPSGMFVKRKKEGEPNFVKGHISVKINDFVMFLKEHGKGKEWLNFDMKLSKEGKLYLQLDTWERDKQEAKVETVEDDPFAGF